MANNWMTGELFMGFERPDFTSNDITRDLVNEMLKALSHTNEKTVCEDLDTMLSLIEVFAKHSDTFESDDYEQIINSLVSGNVVDDIKKLIKANPRMSVVDAVADDLIMRAVAEEIGDTVRFSDEMRDDLYEKIAEALTSTSEINSSVRADLVSAELNDALSEYGVYTNNGLSEKIAEMLIDSVGSTDGTVDLSDIREYFDQYFTIAE